LRRSQRNIFLICRLGGDWLIQKWLIQKRDGLYASHFKALAAADVFAHGHIVTTDHIRLRLGELGAVTLIGPAG
jgi:hypothetical protein